MHEFKCAWMYGYFTVAESNKEVTSTTSLADVTSDTQQEEDTEQLSLQERDTAASTKTGSDVAEAVSDSVSSSHLQQVGDVEVADSIGDGDWSSGVAQDSIEEDMKAPSEKTDTLFVDANTDVTSQSSHARAYILKHEREDLFDARQARDDVSIAERTSASFERTTFTGKTTPSAVDSEKDTDVTTVISLRPSQARSSHSQDVIVVPTASDDGITHTRPSGVSPLKLPSVATKPPTEVATGLLGNWLETLDSQPREGDVIEVNRAEASREKTRKSILRTPSHLGKTSLACLLWRTDVCDVWLTTLPRLLTLQFRFYSVSLSSLHFCVFTFR